MPEQRSTYALHGIRIESPFELSAPISDLACDIAVREGRERSIPDSPPLGRSLAQLGQAGTGYSAGERDGVITIRFHRLADFDFRLESSTLTLHRAPVKERAHAGRDLAAILLESAVLSIILGVKGHFGLHASAVERDGRAIAVIGPTGAGKTTVAALMCADGATLLTDDLLRIDFEDGTPVCHRGTQRLRLRESAAAVGEMIPAASLESTEDDRIAVGFSSTAPAVAELAAIIVPSPDRTAERLSTCRLSAGEALRVLLRTPRTAWSKAEAPLRNHLEGVASLAAETPVVSATIPWGPPFPPRLGSQLLDALA